MAAGALWAVRAPSPAILVFQKARPSVVFLPTSRTDSSTSWELVRKGCRDLMRKKGFNNIILEQPLFLAFRGLAWNLT